MNVERIIPEEMRDAPQVTDAVAKTESITARLVNTEEGICPVCHGQMKLSNANGIDCLVCVPHRIAMPIRN